MLKSLQIKDYALIERIDAEFMNGLNIITGETGAGKSILIGALGLILGERSSSEVVRKGAKKSIVEAFFGVKNNSLVKILLETLQIDCNDEIILRREVNSNGTSRAFINDTPVNLTALKNLGNLLVDLHGQHDHQSLLNTESHIELVDDFAKNEKQIESFENKFVQLNSLQSELKDLINEENELKLKKELYDFQLKEIDEIAPIENEEEELKHELKRLENAEFLEGSASEIYSILYDNEKSVYEILMNVQNEFNKLLSIDKDFSDKLAELNSIIVLTGDISEFLRKYKDDIESDPERLEYIRDRLSSFSLLKKKYGGSIKAILEHRRQISLDISLAENFSEKKKELEKQITEIRNELGYIAYMISVNRTIASKQISKEVIHYLKDLGIEQGQFKVDIKQNEAASDTENYLIYKGKKYHYNDRGFDYVEFHISTNVGEDLKPLAKVASGGEVSRIMLALKSVLAKTEKLPLLIFDEIDSGISGRIARKVGNALQALAENHQILAISHLPQIASMGQFHYSVSKEERQNRTVTNIKKLNNDERLTEIAKLISGEGVTKTSLKTAEELLKTPEFF